MAITLSSASLPVFQTALTNLLHCLEKAEASATARKFDVNVLCAARLAPDMLPFTAQIRIACDAAKIVFPVGRDKTRSMPGEAYLKHYALPNMFFHVVTAYALLRHNGVDLGKVDYLAGPQGA